ncbi:MAG: hypothetical protein OXN97_19465 [Bryobacterales bacterium]|nr:hypothetical protein [Bryobacterales bacterium]
MFASLGAAGEERIEAVCSRAGLEDTFSGYSLNHAVHPSAAANVDQR